MLLEDQNSTTKGNSHHRGQVRVPDLIARAGAAAEAAARSQHIPLEEFLSSEHSRREEYALDKIPFFGYIEIHIEDDSSPTYFLNLKEIRVEAESSGLSGRNEELFEREKWNFELRSGGTLRGVNCE
jgi:hypothetical protein